MAYDPTVMTPGASKSASATSTVKERHARLGEEFIDQVLGNRYRLIKIVGAGGFGAVFEGEDQRIKKKVAVKLLFADMLRDHEAVIRFKLEAEAASRVGHLNIIDITDFDFTEDGTAYMVMEFLEGVDLAHLIRQSDEPDLVRMVRLCLQACRGLGAAHRKGIVHRDLKPGNIFVVRREGAPESVKVVDFGISRASDLDDSEERLTKTGQILGTPYYMAPEQADGIREVDGRTDIYAMGIILFEACTGQLPFMARTPIGLITKHASQAPPDPASLNEYIPAVLRNTILKALEKDPDDRFRDMGEMEQALLGCLAGLDATAAAVELAAATPGSDTGDRVISEEALIALTTPSSILHKTVATPASEKGSPWKWIGIGLGVVVIALAVLLVLKLGGKDGGEPKKRAKHAQRVVIEQDADPMERVVPPPMRELPRPMRRVEAMRPMGTMAPPMIKLECKVVPSTAKVYGPDKKLLGRCKDGIALPKGSKPIRLRVYKVGYVERFVKVTPNRNRSLGPLILRKLPRHMGGGLPDDPMGW